MNKSCLNCSKPFKSRRSTAKYCSNACKTSYNREQQKEVFFKECEVCKTDFHTTNTRKKYCSEKCRRKNAVNNRPKYKRKKYSKVCPTCNTSFKCKKIDRTYCKQSCQPSHKEAKKLRKRTERQCKLSVESWADISKYKESRPKNMELDHIVPLNHPDVCGLHNTWNFQWLSCEDNCKKSNMFDGTLENISWKEKD